MSANVYTIESLLVGKNYRSNSLTGEIISAEPHPKAVWYDGCESYLVEIRNSNGGYAYRTIAVKNPDQIKSKQGQFRECSRPMS